MNSVIIYMKVIYLYLVVLSTRKYECLYENIIFYHLYKPWRNEAVLLVSDVLNS